MGRVKHILVKVANCRCRITKYRRDKCSCVEIFNTPIEAVEAAEAALFAFQDEDEELAYHLEELERNDRWNEYWDEVNRNEEAFWGVPSTTF